VNYEVQVVIPRPLDDLTRRFLNSVQRSANRLVRFTGDALSITFTVEASGMSREDALRAAAGEVARILVATHLRPRDFPANRAPAPYVPFEAG
jgi:hypothetical protein